MYTPPPPPQTEVHAPAQAPKPAKNSENYNQRQPVKESKIQVSEPAITRNVLTHYNAIPQKRVKHTNRLHKRKQAKLRHKRNGR